MDECGSSARKLSLTLLAQEYEEDIAEQTGFRPPVEDGEEAKDRAACSGKFLNHACEVEESIEGEPLNVVVRGEVSSVEHARAISTTYLAQVLGATAVTTATEAEAESQRRAAQIAALSCQVEAARSELAQLRRPSTAASLALAQQARHLITAFQPELGAVKAKLAHTTHVANELHSWFMTPSTWKAGNHGSEPLTISAAAPEIAAFGLGALSCLTLHRSKAVKGVLEAALKDAQPAVTASATWLLELLAVVLLDHTWFLATVSTGENAVRVVYGQMRFILSAHGEYGSITYNF
ncbi:hypothetical protein AK812_SmicGene32197 [Symbiodinium microadriaticum]|uniref:Uncharacterized protein n=1 Tax=Symbiodinium microadriaticum TaxID=2951 RepID=A0A1Q9CUS9_SYMMI|nr:hypothetical protein AK812_SmicGene32197 [Symbiodinium microadriaticum]